MRDDCEDAMVQALGRELKPTEARDVEDTVNLQMRLLARGDPQAWSKLSPDQRLQQGAQAAAQSMIDDLKLKQRRIALQIAAHDRIDNQLSERFDDLDNQEAKPGAKLRAVSALLAFDPKGDGSMSADSWSHAVASEAFGRLLPLWNSVKGFAHIFESKEGVSDLIHEFFGEDTGNAAAKGGAKAWRQVTEELRQRYNAAGGAVGKLDDWAIPQSWSQSRVASAAGDASASVEKFTADMLPLLDRGKYLNADGTRIGDEQMKQMLSRVFDTITTDGANKTEAQFKRETKGGSPSATYSGPGFGGLLADRQSAHRALFFKDADSYLTAQGLYGEKSMWPTLTGHVRSIARDIGMVETLGPNPEQSFRYFNDRTHLDELRQAPDAASKLKAAAKYNEALFDVVASGGQGVVNDKIAAAGQTFRNFETATKLGSVALTAVGDEAGMAATAFANHVPFSEVFMREMHYLNPVNGDDRAVAMHAGLGINRMIGGLNRFGQEDLQLFGGDSKLEAARNITSKLATGVLNASGAEGMWDARRRALGSVLMSYLGKWTREVDNFKDVSFDDHGMLARKGVSETDWQVWKRAELEDWGMKHGVLTPDSVWQIPDEKLQDLGDPTSLKRHASTMLLGHVLEETGMGVMDTGPRERTAMQFGTQAGTVAGELTRSALLFKSFSASMMMKHWARAASMPTGSSKAQYAATLLVTGTVLGALATQLRNVTSGKNPANMAEPQFWGESLLRGGGLGFYGDFLYSEMTQHDTSLIPALMGPLATETEQAWNLTGAAAFKSARGEHTDEGAKLVRWARGNVPFLNMWYTKAAFDHLIWNNMQEAANPGYLDRMQAKAYNDKGTTWWYQPQEGAPSSAPDLAQAWQPERGREQIQKMADTLGINR